MGSAGYFYPLARVRDQVEALQGLQQGHAAALAGAAEQWTLSVAKRQGPKQASESPPATTETGDVEGAKSFAGRAKRPTFHLLRVNKCKVASTNYIKAVIHVRL